MPCKQQKVLKKGNISNYIETIPLLASIEKSSCNHNSSSFNSTINYSSSRKTSSSSSC